MFQQFLNKAPCSSFKKLVILTPLLLQGLHMMSLAKSVPEGLAQNYVSHCLSHACPIRMRSKKKVAKLRNLQIKTFLEKDTMLNFQVWHKNGTQEAFLMHVTAVLDAIKKRGTFKDQPNKLMRKPRKRLSWQRLV